MKPTSMKEIINFATEREKDAIKLYTDLQSDAAFSAIEDYLKELVSMEKGHIVILQDMLKGDFEGKELSQVPDLELSDYFVAPKKEGSLDYQDVLELAMAREQAAKDLYTRLAGSMEDSKYGEMFLKIAAEEAGHKHHFEELYDQEILLEN